MSGDRDTPGATSPVQLGTVPYDDSAEFWKAVYLMSASRLFDGRDPDLVADDALAEYRARFPVYSAPREFSGWDALFRCPILVATDDGPPIPTGFPVVIYFFGDDGEYTKHYVATADEFATWRRKIYGTTPPP